MSYTLLGVDTGGTFTDFVALNLQQGSIRIHKVLSTPAAPEQAIVQGVKDLNLDVQHLKMVHGSTVATNAVLEGKGVPVAYVTNKGLKDVLSIARQNRAELYNLNPAPVPPPVPAELCFELDVRTAADGSVIQELSDAELTRLAQAIRSSGAEAVAINLLFSYLDDGHEQQIEAALADLPIFISRSSKVLAEYKEYERGIATWISASVGPLMQGYLQRLQAALAPAPISVMQSTGGAISVDTAAQHAVRLLLSGPAGGLMGARYVAQQAGITKLLTFDVGGTSTDVALIDTELSLTSQGHMGRYPIAVPMVDMHTIGAGGGSLACCDSGGLLQVGPESAGAMPGPACYGQGGTQATVTDANVVLGRLPSLSALGGELRLQVGLAKQALHELADGLGLGSMQAAQGVVRLANEHMARALRVISVERGVDVNDYTLTCFGGAGGLHVCALAELMNMRSALVPVHGGVLSALGMLVAPLRRDRSRTLNVLLHAISAAQLAQQLQAMYQSLRDELSKEGVRQELALNVVYTLDLRYQGQSSSLPIPWSGDVGAAAECFNMMHQQQFGHQMDIAIELVNIRVLLTGAEPDVALPLLEGDSAEQRIEQAFMGRSVVDGHGEVDCYQRDQLIAGAYLSGPAIVVETVATTWLAAGWNMTVDSVGNLLLHKTP